MTIGIICAMQSELQHVKALLHDEHEVKVLNWTYVEGKLDNHIIVVAKSGVGKVNAAVSAANLIAKYAPQVLLNTGVAGGIDASLSVMDIVVGKRTAYHDVDCGPDVLRGQIQDMPLYFEADSRLFDAAMRVKSKTKIHDGLICTGDQFITDQAQLKIIKQKFPEGLAVDMESAAIAQVCHILATPFLSFRIISDTPGIKGHIDQYFNFWDEMATRSFAVTKLFLEEISRLDLKS